MLERLRSAGEQPVTLDELRAVGIDFPAVVLSELEINGYVIERRHEHGRLLGVRLRESDTPDAPGASDGADDRASQRRSKQWCARRQLVGVSNSNPSRSTAGRRDPADSARQSNRVLSGWM